MHSYGNCEALKTVECSVVQEHRAMTDAGSSITTLAQDLPQPSSLKKPERYVALMWQSCSSEVPS